MQQAFGISKRPIAIGFLQAPPSGMHPWPAGSVPAGCSFWKAAWEGQSFYTVASDHYNCAVGAYTHGISLPAERGPVLSDTIGFMVDQGYLRMPEVPGIPVISPAPEYIAYSPAEDAPFAPDVVLIAARPASAMLLYEAALRAGAGDALTPAMGRPACAVLPLALKSTAMSFGCKGNRTFTGLPDDELYMAIPGGKWDAMMKAAESIVRANTAMEAHYRAHEAAVSAG